MEDKILHRMGIRIKQLSR